MTTCLDATKFDKQFLREASFQTFVVRFEADVLISCWSFRIHVFSIVHKVLKQDVATYKTANCDELPRFDPGTEAVAGAKVSLAITVLTL